MKAIDLKKLLKPYKEGWVAIDENNKRVIAHAKTIKLISKKIKNERVLLVPASKSYFGFVTTV